MSIPVVVWYIEVHTATAMAVAVASQTATANRLTAKALGCH